MKCPYCNHEIANNAKLCPHCGWMRSEYDMSEFSCGERLFFMGVVVCAFVICFCFNSFYVAMGVLLFSGIAFIIVSWLKANMKK